MSACEYVLSLCHSRMYISTIALHGCSATCCKTCLMPADLHLLFVSRLDCLLLCWKCCGALTWQDVAAGTALSLPATIWGKSVVPMQTVCTFFLKLCVFWSERLLVP